MQRGDVVSTAQVLRLAPPNTPTAQQAASSKQAPLRICIVDRHPRPPGERHHLRPWPPRDRPPTTPRAPIVAVMEVADVGPPAHRWPHAPQAGPSLGPFAAQSILCHSYLSAS